MSAPAVAPEQEATRRTPWMVDVAVIAGTFGLWWMIMFAAAQAVGLDPWATSSWGRWDSGHYLSVADGGYVYERCVGIPNRGPDDWCGNSGWFPLYPYLMRVVGWFGFGHITAGRAISVVAMVGAWATLWIGFLRRRPLAAGVAGMAIAAAFPASVYYGAVFPISMTLLATMLAMLCLDRRRWLLAGLCGAVAAMTYTSGIVIVVLALVPLLSQAVGDGRDRLRAVGMVGGPIVAGYLIVLANFERDVGAWNASFNTQASYRFEPAFPFVTIWRQAAALVDDTEPGIIGVQTLLVATMVIAALTIAWRHRTVLSLGEWGVALLASVWWLLPLTLGGDLSLYRAESLLLPVVVLLARLPAPAVAAFAATSVPVSYLMAKLFFNATLM